MTFDAREFVAEDCWLLIGVVTFALLSLVGLAGLEALAGVIAIVGWFLLVPLFLFWGEEIADIALGDDSKPDHTVDDPFEELKRRYAVGEIDDEEFERRIDRLVGIDGAFEDVFSEAETASKPSETETSAPRERELDENR
ncbi:hypothetical protein C491_11658 [Natronococcus amylolyticus DSM 10524]|uniref:SHOCT domain-containing protein n=1 Tax=Natronococcus amylolyticus DSM 10524 TaxID=1227497 RepID=L9X627_9EURY|nr:SHOCT domain-containing protein [Natronococcus amylolyticus]ELY57155.1 hypothetical protein C491_11658 [Natronococcus amylolyticus DSM 10524]